MSTTSIWRIPCMPCASSSSITRRVLDLGLPLRFMLLGFASNHFPFMLAGFAIVDVVKSLLLCMVINSF